MTPNGLGWIIVDALDTMMLMNLTSELTHARKWIKDDLTYEQDHDVSTFETTIRMLGGLLSAHYLSTTFPDAYAPVKDGLSDDLYIEKAADLADRLLGAFETSSGVPLASVNLQTRKGLPSHADAGASSTAEATSVQLELKYLAKLTGEDHYWDKAEKVMQVVDRQHPEDGLVPIFIYAEQGAFRGNNIRLGSRGDSYYEYLIKQYLQTSQQEPVYQGMWNESMKGIKKHLLTYSYPHNFTVLAERPNGLNRDLQAKMDHLVAFMPGTIALATTGGLPLDQARKLPSWGPEQEEDMLLAEELMKTFWAMYTVTPTGLAPEITYFNVHDPPLMYEDLSPSERPRGPELSGVSTGQDDFSDYIIKSADTHNLQRPETVESLFYMWRITGDEKYREWGWRMFESFIKHTATPDGKGYSSISSVNELPPPLRDNMESFWLVSVSFLSFVGAEHNAHANVLRRLRRSNTSTFSSLRRMSCRLLMWCSILRHTLSQDSSWVSCSRLVGRGISRVLRRRARVALRRRRVMLPVVGRLRPVHLLRENGRPRRESRREKKSRRWLLRILKSLGRADACNMFQKKSVMNGET